MISNNIFFLTLFPPPDHGTYLKSNSQQSRNLFQSLQTGQDYLELKVAYQRATTPSQKQSLDPRFFQGENPYLQYIRFFMFFSLSLCSENRVLFEKKTTLSLSVWGSNIRFFFHLSKRPNLFFLFFTTFSYKEWKRTFFLLNILATRMRKIPSSFESILSV